MTCATNYWHSVYVGPGSLHIGNAILSASPDGNLIVQNIQITGEIDTISTGGTPAGVGYTTVPRHAEEE